MATRAMTSTLRMSIPSRTLFTCRSDDERSTGRGDDLTRRPRVLRHVPSMRALDRHFVADLQCPRLEAAAYQRRGGASFEPPCLDLARCVGDVEDELRMRVDEAYLGNDAGDDHWLGGIECGRERMVRSCARSGEHHQRARDGQARYRKLHKTPPYLNDSHDPNDPNDPNDSLPRNDFVGGQPPAPAVLRPPQRDEAHAVILGITSRVAG